MFKAFSFFLALAMLAWVLPLGAFIKSSQEATACGGKRAMHMCSMMSGKAKKEAPKGVTFTNASSVEKTAKSSVSGGDDIILALGHSTRIKRIDSSFVVNYFLLTQFSPKIVDPPPRVY